jgi:hypothetical protein
LRQRDGVLDELCPKLIIGREIAEKLLSPSVSSG